jgi:hypothetical protein
MIDAKSKPQDRAAILSRIASALRGEIPTQDLEPLIRASGLAMIAARGFAAEARQWAMDPALPQDAVADALTAANAAEFDATRMEGAFAKLEENAAAARDREERVEHLRQYSETAERAKKCAEMIRRDFSEVSRLLLPMVKEIVKVALEVNAMNANLPPNARPINSPEGQARGFLDQGTAETRGNLEIIRISQMVIPVLDDPTGVSWPAGYHAHRDGPLTKPYAWFVSRYRATFGQKPRNHE